MSTNVTIQDVPLALQSQDEMEQLERALNEMNRDEELAGTQTEDAENPTFIPRCVVSPSLGAEMKKVQDEKIPDKTPPPEVKAPIFNGMLGPLGEAMKIATSNPELVKTIMGKLGGMGNVMASMLPILEQMTPPSSGQAAAPTAARAAAAPAAAAAAAAPTAAPTAAAAPAAAAAAPTAAATDAAPAAAPPAAAPAPRKISPTIRLPTMFQQCPPTAGLTCRLWSHHRPQSIPFLQEMVGYLCTIAGNGLGRIFNTCPNKIIPHIQMVVQLLLARTDVRNFLSQIETTYLNDPLIKEFVRMGFKSLVEISSQKGAAAMLTVQQEKATKESEVRKLQLQAFNAMEVELGHLQYLFDDVTDRVKVLEGKMSSSEDSEDMSSDDDDISSSQNSREKEREFYDDRIFDMQTELGEVQQELKELKETIKDRDLTNDARILDMQVEMAELQEMKELNETVKKDRHLTKVINRADVINITENHSSKKKKSKERNRVQMQRAVAESDFIGEFDEEMSEPCHPVPPASRKVKDKKRIPTQREIDDLLEEFGE